mgnify:CR=1 FL=1
MPCCIVDGVSDDMGEEVTRKNASKTDSVGGQLIGPGCWWKGRSQTMIPRYPQSPLSAATAASSTTPATTNASGWVG